MSEQIVKQRARGFICINAHPEGCAQAVERQIAAVAAAKPKGLGGPRRALIIGSSTGYGLATRIALGWGFGAKTLGIFFEKAPDGKRTATAGWYNSVAVHAAARRDGLWAESLNGDAFSDDMKLQAADKIREELGQVDLVVYSLAAPKRTNPQTGKVSGSTLKTIGEGYVSKSIDLGNGKVGDAAVMAAHPDEIAETIEVMGGEDWRWWIEKLAVEDLLAPGARTLAYSYIGPELTYPIYRDGTIGAAKKDLEKTAKEINAELQDKLGGGAWVAVNKAVVTQASSAIPIVPLYISILFKVMKEKGVHEGCIEQMIRLAFEHLAEGKSPTLDENGLIRLDDLELRADVQQAVEEIWPKVTTDNLAEIADFAGFKSDFNRLFGFEVEGVDYAKPVETEVGL